VRKVYNYSSETTLSGLEWILQKDLIHIERVNLTYNENQSI